MFSNLSPISLATRHPVAPGQFVVIRVLPAVGTMMQDSLMSPPGLEVLADSLHTWAFSPGIPRGPNTRTS